MLKLFSLVHRRHIIIASILSAATYLYDSLPTIPFMGSYYLHIGDLIYPKEDLQKNTLYSTATFLTQLY